MLHQYQKCLVSSVSTVLRNTYRMKSSTAFFHCTRVNWSTRAPKTNPNETQSGRFDKSFEKLTAMIEERLPMSQKNCIRGTVHDRLFGEESDVDLRKAAQDDLHGREEEKVAAKIARSYFSEEDLSPEALHVRSPHLKVAQNIQRQYYDKKILNTSNESEAYYYKIDSPAEKRRVFQIRVIVFFAVGTVSVYFCQILLAWMRTG